MSDPITLNNSTEIAKSPSNDGAEATLAALGMNPGAALPPMMDGLTSAKPRKKIHFSAITMVLAVGIAGGLLVGMRQMGIGPKSVLGADVQPPELKANSAAQELILAELTASRTVNQVPSSSVKKNPFKMIFAIGLPAKPDVALVTSSGKADPEAVRMAQLAARKLERDKAIQTAKGNLKVQSIVIGSRPVARINGEVYRVGDVVETYFTIKSIVGRGVEFEVDDQLFTVEMTVEVGKGK